MLNKIIKSLEDYGLRNNEGCLTDEQKAELEAQITYLKNLRVNNDTSVSDEGNLLNMLTQFQILSQSNNIRWFFEDKDVNSDTVCDNADIFNFFCACEEIAFLLRKKDYQSAAKFIRAFKNNELDS